MSYSTILQKGSASSPGAIVFPLDELYKQWFTDSQQSTDMIVDGSETPVEFSIPASSNFDIAIHEIRILFVASTLNIGGTYFGAGSALTNGTLLKIVRTGHDDVEIGNVKINEDFLTLTGMLVEPITADLNSDLLCIRLHLGCDTILKKGTSDKATITIRDDVTNVANGIQLLTALLFGRKK